MRKKNSTMTLLTQIKGPINKKKRERKKRIICTNTYRMKVTLKQTATQEGIERKLVLINSLREPFETSKESNCHLDIKNAITEQKPTRLSRTINKTRMYFIDPNMQI